MAKKNNKLEDILTIKDIWDTSIMILNSISNKKFSNEYIKGWPTDDFKYYEPNKYIHDLHIYHINIIKKLCDSIHYIDNYLEDYRKNICSVKIEDTVQGDFLICLEDGQKVKKLHQHILKKYGMSESQYISKWNLPLDYPFIAPNVSKRRSDIMKKTMREHYKKSKKK